MFGPKWNVAINPDPQNLGTIMGEGPERMQEPVDGVESCETPSSRHGTEGALASSPKLWSLAQDLHKAKSTIAVSSPSGSTNCNQ